MLLVTTEVLIFLNQMFRNAEGSGKEVNPLLGHFRKQPPKQPVKRRNHVSSAFSFLRISPGQYHLIQMTSLQKLIQLFLVATTLVPKKVRNRFGMSCLIRNCFYTPLIFSHSTRVSCFQKLEELSKVRSSLNCD